MENKFIFSLVAFYLLLMRLPRIRHHLPYAYKFFEFPVNYECDLRTTYRLRRADEGPQGLKVHPLRAHEAIGEGQGDKSEQAAGEGSCHSKEARAEEPSGYRAPSAQEEEQNVGRKRRAVPRVDWGGAWVSQAAPIAPANLLVISAEPVY